MGIKEWIETENGILLELIVFVLGGIAYGAREILFRGYTHWTMVLTGGACILTFYLLSDWMMSMPLVAAALVGAAIITLYEFSVGYIVNVRLGWDVWDYSREKFNVMGQICPMFSLVWFSLSFTWLGAIRVIRLFL